jgi:arginyl-tRNA synthetase
VKRLSYTFGFSGEGLKEPNTLNLIELQQSLRERVRAAAAAKFGIELEQVPAEVPPRTELGDLAFPVAFELAKRIKQATGEKRNPRAIAEELRQELLAAEEVARVEVAGAGYLNLFYDRARLLAGLRPTAAEESSAAASPDESRPKRMVEHTSVNPNKAAHIGHLRNSVIGDTFVRILRANGERVEVHNYIDNTGVQVADVVVGFIHLEGMSLEDVRALDASLKEDYPFDYYCWDLYARVGLFYRDGDPDAKEDPERLKLRVETLHALEEGKSATAELADYVATRIVGCHLDTMSRLGITYDLLPRESEVLHFLWSHAFERMKESGAIRFEEGGRNRGCWVMPMETHEGSDEHEADKVIVRSNGTVTYTGKDIAYQLWKLGQVDLNFYFKPFRRDEGHAVWTTTSNREEAAAEAPHFGAGATVYNVIDSRQSYPQEVVKRGVAAIAPQVGEQASVHLSYEMVALSPAAAEELGLELSAEERSRPFVEMSGRRGLGVKADDLIETLEANALREVRERHPEVTLEEQSRAAHILAVGALRYFLLKWTRNSVIVFDFKEALSTKGEAGPYCQYAAVRANSIFRKLPEGEPETAERIVASAAREGGEAGQGVERVFEGEVGGEIWALVTLAARLPEVLMQAAAFAEPSHLARYTFQLAQAFNFFYNRDENRILEERDAARRAVLVYVTDFVRKQLTAALATLGIEVPERM